MHVYIYINPPHFELTKDPFLKVVNFSNEETFLNVFEFKVYTCSVQNTKEIARV